MKSSIPIQSPEELRVLLGVNDKHARLFRSEFNVALTLRKGALQLEGEQGDVESARRVAEEVIGRYRKSGLVDAAEVELLIRTGAGEPQETRAAPTALGEPILKTKDHRPIAPRTAMQQRYVESMLRSELVFAIGPAGTGKTYLAVAMAIRMLREGEVKKLILTRPAVEAGEKLGFLPGTFEAKVNPYLRPLYDALYDLMDAAHLRKYSENDIIEVAPLAYMRGRTLSDAFIILDEAQNTTPAQMKMFLSRMGQSSRVVVTGDVTQIDLPRHVVSGLVHAARILSETEGIRFCNFRRSDIIRHPLVQRILDAYEHDLPDESAE